MDRRHAAGLGRAPQGVLLALLLAAPLSTWTPGAGPVAASTADGAPGQARAAAAVLTSGAAHSCAIVPDGLKCWGANSYGQLGIGIGFNFGQTPLRTGDSLPFAALPPGRQAIDVAAGSSHTCAILDNGTLRCWGRADNGALGMGPPTGNELSPLDAPVAVGAGRTVQAIAAGGNHTCAILDNGALTCWGSNGEGQLGRGSTGSPVYAPPSSGVNLGSGRTAVAVAAGSAHTCVILDNGAVKCWGRAGTAGDGSNSVRDAPPAATVNLGPGRTAVAISAGDRHTCAVLDNGGMKCWGGGSNGQLGTGSPADQLAPPVVSVNLGAGRTARAVSAGLFHTCALLDDATTKCWGLNTSGRLGYGDEGQRNAPPANPVNLGVGQLALAVAAGGEHTCALLQSGRVKCWGRNNSGQLNLGDTSNRFAPIATPMNLGTTRSVQQVAAGYQNTCAITDGGELRCWGSNQDGKLGIGSFGGPNVLAPPVNPIFLGAGRSAKKVAVGVGSPSRVCAILDNDTLKCWGSSHGNAPPVNPLDFGPGRTVRDVATGYDFVCAVLDNGETRCWGWGANGGLGYGNTSSIATPPATGVNLGTGRRATAVAAGLYHTCVILDTGGVKCWGENSFGEAGVGNKNPQLSPPAAPINLGSGRRAVQIAAGGVHTCALLDDGTVKCWGGNGAALGQGSISELTAPPANPVNLGSGGPAVAVAVGETLSCALQQAGTVKCWGFNSSGQLGQGNTTTLNTPPANPVDLGAGVQVQSVASGVTGACAITTRAKLRCWGQGAQGQLGYGDTSNRGHTSTTVGHRLPVVSFGGDPLLVAPGPHAFEPLNPARLLDTRATGQTIDGQFRNLGLRPARSVVELRVTGRAGVPIGAGAVVVNLTVSGTQAAGFITAYPCGTTRPNASNLNYAAGQTVANLAVVKVGTGGRICLYNESATQLLADVTGYQPRFTAYGSLNPARLLDTRSSGNTIDGQFRRIGLRERRSTTTVQIAGRGGVPSSAVAVVLNVTVTAPQANGFITVYPCGTRPNASNLNYVRGQTVANLVVARLDAQGRVCLFTEAAAQLIADVAGAHPTADPLVALTPARLLDTRASGQTVDGQGRFTAPRPAGSVTEVQIRGRAGVPGDATTAVVNLTATGAQANGFVTAFPCGTSRPLTSSLNYRAGQTVPNLAIVKIGTGGRICLYTEATTHLLADITAAY